MTFVLYLVATLMQGSGNAYLGKLWSRGTHFMFEWSSCLAVFVVYFLMTIWTAGSAISGGIFVPILLVDWIRNFNWQCAITNKRYRDSWYYDIISRHIMTFHEPIHDNIMMWMDSWLTFVTADDGVDSIPMNASTKHQKKTALNTRGTQ